MSTYIPPPDNGLDIVLADEHLLIINKPAGLLSVPGRGPEKQDCLISRVQREYPAALTVHRLDMSTSGLMVLALGKTMERALSILFQQRKVLKRYIAVVSGIPEPHKGDIDLPLITDWPNRPRQMVSYEHGKPSQTRFQVLNHHAGNNTSRVELKPLTGRTHQLRVHMMSVGHSILGDEFYASPEVFAQADRLLLHAAYLEFTHPVTGITINAESPAPF
ncbi:MAG: pseudouridine synthase [Thiolinea sp.]